MYNTSIKKTIPGGSTKKMIPDGNVRKYIPEDMMMKKRAPRKRVIDPGGLLVRKYPQPIASENVFNKVQSVMAKSVKQKTV